MPRIGNRNYPPVLSEGQRSVMSGLLNDPGWEKFSRPKTQIGNRTYADETTGSAPSTAITPDLHRYSAGLGKTANDLTLDELNQFIDQHYGAQPSPKAMYKLPSNY